MRAARREHVGVALFPFLAVLICTMGALIVLLVLLVQQARVDAHTIALGQSGGSADAKTREQLEDSQWRSELLQQSRSEKTAELAESRDKLAHLEDHIQQLEAQANELMTRARQIDEGHQLRDSDLAAARGELARVQQEIEQKRAELEAAKRKAESSQQWFALIPYDGPNGTRRRPIYLECTELGVVIQPEGILLGNADFDGPRGPGNPLDAAVRTIRDHVLRTGGSKAGAAYPLLVVRPGGIPAYNAAREALQAWDDEFGYELVGDDKRLDFGPADPALAQSLKGSLTAARQRQAVMAAMMPRRFQSQEPTPAAPPESAKMFGAAAPPGTGGRGAGSGGGGSGTDLAGGTGGGLGDPLAASALSGVAAGGGKPAGGGLSGQGASGLSGGVGGQVTGSGPGGSTSPGGGSSAGQSGIGTSPPSGSSGGTAAGGQTQAGGATGGYAGQAGASGAAGGSAGSLTGGAVGGQPSPNLQFGSPRPSGGQNTGQSAAPKTGQSRTGSATATSGSRGSNWGLPGSRGRTTAVTRPLHVAVLRDRLILIPDQGENRPPKHLPISPELQPADVDRFVTAVQSEIKGWGLAVEDGYWKPILRFDVAAGAERQFAELQTALSGSGFEIERRSP